MKINLRNQIVLFASLMYMFNVYSQPVIADHRAVDRYDAIPDEYIAKVKTMLLNIVGESHARGYRYGLQLLANQNHKCSISYKVKGFPEAPFNNYLRVSGAMLLSNNKWTISVGEEEAWTSSWGVNNLIKTVKHMDKAGNKKSALGIGWCYDMLTGTPSTKADPVHGCRWYGRSVIYNGTGGTSLSFEDPGWGVWGLDHNDSVSIGGKCVTMDMYIRAIEKANASSSNTIVFYSTGPVDYKAARFYEAGREDLYQVEVKHEYIREYVRKSKNAYLFDYADILCWDEKDNERKETWNGHSYQKMQTKYIGDYDGGTGHGCHINEEGCLRLGKAMWWMLAHMVGWKDETIISADK